VSNDKDWGEEFMNSTWAHKGSDPKNERKVRDEFGNKQKKTIHLLSDEFWSQGEAMYDYVKSGNDRSVKALIVGALLYFISPADFIPDVIPILGYVDDIAVVATVYKLVKDSLSVSPARKTRMDSRRTPNPDLED
jgi:uncharacterized membrane protein YkvA (DUF1232 family)